MLPAPTGFTDVGFTGTEMTQAPGDVGKFGAAVAGLEVPAVADEFVVAGFGEAGELGVAGGFVEVPVVG